MIKETIGEVYAVRNKKPPFEITEAALSDVMEISELVGKISSTQNLSTSPILRCQNRIRTIYSSLAIEQNILSLEQVTAVLSGKRVLAPPKAIAEVKNAYEIYDHLAELDPYSIDDLLLAHRTMMQGLVREAGEFRSRPVGAVDSKGNVLHFGTLPQYVPSLMEELVQWTESSPFPLLIKSCVFHYEFEVIHPFADGNGRMGRLWHTLLLSKWNSLFAWLPIESIIHDHQPEYYAAINQSNAQGEGTVFIEFMLGVIKEALQEAISEQPAEKPTMQSKEELRWEKIADFLRRNSTIQNSDVQNLLDVSPATASRILNALTKEGKLIKVRRGRYWAYRATK
jgi:Fic family protein